MVDGRYKSDIEVTLNNISLLVVPLRRDFLCRKHRSVFTGKIVTIHGESHGEDSR